MMVNVDSDSTCLVTVTLPYNKSKNLLYFGVYNEVGKAPS